MILPYFSSPTELTVLKSGHHGYIDTDKIVNINELSNENLDLDTSESLLVLKPLYCKRNMKRDDKFKHYNRGKEVQSSFDRLLVCLDIMALPGQNIVAFLLGDGRNENIFNSCLKERDSGDAGMYSIVCFIVSRYCVCLYLCTALIIIIVSLLLLLL